MILLCFKAVTAFAEGDLLASVSQQLLRADQLSGLFEQEKTLPFLQNPLKSSGDYSISAEQGLRWRVTAPLVSEMTVDVSGVKLDGRDVDDRGTGELMAKLMQSFMTGDLSGIADTFKVSGERCAESWLLNLEPRAALLGFVLDHIEVRGDTLLRQVTITETGKAVTVLRLSQVSPVDVSASVPDAPDSHVTPP